VGVICAALLVPAMAVAAVFVVRSHGVTPTSHPRAGSARAGTASSPAAQSLSTAGTARGYLSPGSGQAAGRDQRPPGQQLAVATQVLALINQARAQAGLARYSLSSRLGRSAGAHNALMAAGCGLSHQCPGELPLGTRETDADVSWTSAGENIGQGGPVPDTSAAIAQMALALAQDMLNEKPPDDGHRLNILSSSFQIIGIAVFRDSSGTVWMTQDFAN